MPAVTLAVEAMACRFELVLVGDSEPRLRAVGEEALHEILESHARLNRFDRGSDIARINESAGLAGAARVDPRVFELVRRAVEIGARTAGGFDITVAPTMDALFGGSVGSRGVIDASRIELDPSRRTVRLPEPGMGIDLGAIAKGWALDEAGAILREHGVERAMLHGGTSSILALGSPFGRDDGWAIAVHSPRPEAPGPTIVLRDMAMGVSELHGRTRGGEGHVLDPRTGRPARGTLVAVVVAPSACDADAWSTAALASAGRPAGFDRGWGLAVLPEEGPWKFEGLRRDAAGRYTL